MDLALIFERYGRRDKKDLEEWMETGESSLGARWRPLELMF